MASPVLLFFIGTVSFIYTVFSQVQETEFVSEDNIYYPPFVLLEIFCFFLRFSFAFLLISSLIILIALFYYQRLS